MKFTEMGLENGKTMLLLPGTACTWEINFHTVIDRLAEQYHLICVDYDGFDDEKAEKPFTDMLTVTEKIENYILEKHRYIVDFMKREPNGVIVQLGCGLETTYYRDDNGRTQWYGVDLPHVIEYRKSLLPEPEREAYIAGDAFHKDWIEQIRTAHPTAPILITASGLFYYFEEERVLSLIRTLQSYGEIELLFDTVSKSGMTMMRKKHMKTVGHEDAKMFFYVDSATDLAKTVGGNVKVLSEEPFYRHINKRGLKFSTKVSMVISDRLAMVKMIHLHL